MHLATLNRFDTMKAHRLSMMIRLGFAALLVGASTFSPAQESELNIVGKWPGFTRGPAVDVAVAGNHAYVAGREAGLIVVT